MNLKKLSILVYIISGFLFACAAREHAAPIENATAIPNYLKQDIMVENVKSNVKEPVSEEPQLGSLDSNENKTSQMPKKQPQTKKVYQVANANPNIEQPSKLANPPTVVNNSLSDKQNTEWVLPTQGKNFQKFIAANKGIDISGNEGQAIYSTNSGNVVYSGNGLKGYGNLIIIKHKNTYLSAYAHNKINLVKAGDNVERGQKIAEMGLNDNNKPILHFEIRQNGKPIDPMQMVKN